MRYKGKRIERRYVEEGRERRKETKKRNAERDRQKKNMKKKRGTGIWMKSDKWNK